MHTEYRINGNSETVFCTNTSSIYFCLKKSHNSILYDYLPFKCLFPTLKQERNFFWDSHLYLPDRIEAITGLNHLKTQTNDFSCVSIIFFSRQKLRQG